MDGQTGNTVIETLNIVEHVQGLQDMVVSAVPIMLGVSIAFATFYLARKAIFGTK